MPPMIVPRNRAERRAFMRLNPDWRRQMRPFKRAFGGDRRTQDQLLRCTMAAHERDSKIVREAIVLGARTVAAVATKTGLRQGRVRRIIEVEEIKAVTS